MSGRAPHKTGGEDLRDEENGLSGPLNDQNGIHSITILIDQIRFSFSRQKDQNCPFARSHCRVYIRFFFSPEIRFWLRSLHGNEKVIS